VLAGLRDIGVTLLDVRVVEPPEPAGGGASRETS
jgi:hypothetical protein